MSEPSKRGSSGGNARAAKLTPEERSKIAKAAAAKRWARKGKEETIDALKKADTEWLNNQIDNLPKVTTTITPNTGEGTVINLEHPNHCPACAMGQILEKGEGTHVLLTVEHPTLADPVPTIPTPPPQPTAAPQPQRKRSSKPMPKAFKGASSYAEKRLAEAIKERAEFMGRVAALNAEIPSLVQVIRALGTSTILPEALQSYPMQMPNYGPQVQKNYPVDPMQNLPNPIDPALFQANSGPLPGLVPAAANAPMIPNTSVGGAMDLDYVPTDDEGPGLPKMGGGWM
jgi:hypothetical protein